MSRLLRKETGWPAGIIRQASRFLATEVSSATAISPADLDPVAFARTRLHFDPDPRQIDVLACTTGNGILNCTRQWGKSTVAAAKATHRAFIRAASTVLVASPTERQSAEFVRKAAGFVSELGIRPRGDGDNSTSLLLPNGSRIVGLPGTEGTIRGFSAVSLLIIDEASRVDDTVYKALRPMLAVGAGDLWLLSTPYGKRGFFYETWRNHDDPDWCRISVPATECPRISPAFLEKERRALDRDWFAQEYLAEFIDNGHSYFSLDKLESVIDPSFNSLRFT